MSKSVIIEQPKDRSTVTTAGQPTKSPYIKKQRMVILRDLTGKERNMVSFINNHLTGVANVRQNLTEKYNLQPATTVYPKIHEKDLRLGAYITPTLLKNERRAASQLKSARFSTEESIDPSRLSRNRNSAFATHDRPTSEMKPY